MTHRVTMDVPDSLYTSISEAAEHEFRTIEAQILWTLRVRYETGFRVGKETSSQIIVNRRIFADELTNLHVQAGRPSLRSIALKTSFSHSSVHGYLRGQRIPSWAHTQELVEYLHGDLGKFKELWVQCQENHIADYMREEDNA